MKRGIFAPAREAVELLEAIQSVRDRVAAPDENEEGYDPHVEHRDYERLKEEMRKTREELAKARANERELGEALAEMETRAARQPEKTGTDWRRAIVLSEVLGPPRGRKK